MKIKLDFVSNSSSTSFLFIQKSDEFSLQTFLSAAGISNESPLLDLFENIYYTINSKIKHGRKITNIEELDIFLERSNLDDKSLVKVKQAIQSDLPIISSRFSTDEGDIYEAFLCHESFEIDCDDFLLSAYEDMY